LKFLNPFLVRITFLALMVENAATAELLALPADANERLLAENVL